MNKLIFDKQRESYQVLGYKQFDTEQPINATFFNDGKPIDLSKYNIRFECKKADGNFVIAEEDINVLNTNEIEAFFNKQVTSYGGTVCCQFVLIHKETARYNTTFTFELDVQTSVIDANGYSGSFVSYADRLNQNVIDAKQLHVILTDDIALGEMVSDDLIAKTNDGKTTATDLANKTSAGNTTLSKLDTSINTATQKKTGLDDSITRATEINKTITTNADVADVASKKLKETIIEAQDDIAVIESTGNETVTVLASEWVYNNESKMYEKEVTHQCASENIHITCKSSDTKDALFLPWRIIDKSKILLKSDEAIGVTLVINSRYYKAVQTISDDIAQEVLEGRQGKSNLLTNMNRKINYENFTGNSIN